MTDKNKKIEEYLERAKKISKSEYGTSTPEMIIEIAKMIQLEEHRVPYQAEIVRKIVDDWNKRAKENLEEMGRQANKPL